jgi:hypothetical protein
MISIILLIFFVLVGTILLFPVTLSVDSIRSDGKIRGSVRFTWTLFALLYKLKERQFEVLMFNRRIIRHVSHEGNKQQLKHSEKPEKEFRKPRKKPGIEEVLRLIGPALRLFKELVNAIRLKIIDFKVTFGLNDPAFTGILSGFLHAAGLSRMDNIRWAPDFKGQIMDWDINVQSSITPIRLIPPFARFIANRQVLRSLWGMIR